MQVCRYVGRQKCYNVQLYISLFHIANFYSSFIHLSGCQDCSMVFFLCQRVRIKVTKFILMPVPASKQIYITCCVLKCATKFSSHISELRCVLVFREAILFITFLADSLLNRLFSNRIKITGLPKKEFNYSYCYHGKTRKRLHRNFFQRC